MPKKIPSPVCGFRAVHAEAVRNRWGSVKTSYITAIPIARATTHPGSSGVGFFILSCSHPAMASQRRRMTSICCSSFNPAFNNDEQRAFVARRSFIFVPQPCLQRRRMTSICCSLFIHFCSSTLPSTTVNDERRAFVARRSTLPSTTTNDEHLLLVVHALLFLNPAFNDNERRAFVARRSTLPSTTTNDEHLLLVVHSLLFLNPAFNDNERRAFVARRSFIFGELKRKHKKVYT